MPPIALFDLVVPMICSGGGQSIADYEIVREKFSKLLLGEDMSGTGKGVSSALALSNAITNLAGKSFHIFPM
jgi:hypothetical protein